MNQLICKHRPMCSFVLIIVFLAAWGQRLDQSRQKRLPLGIAMHSSMEKFLVQPIGFFKRDSSFWRARQPSHAKNVKPLCTYHSPWAPSACYHDIFLCDDVHLSPNNFRESFLSYLILRNTSRFRDGSQKDRHARGYREHWCNDEELDAKDFRGFKYQGVLRE